MRTQLVILFLTLMSLAWEAHSTLNPLPLINGLSTENGTRMMIEYLETQLEMQRKTIVNLEHMIGMTNNSFNYGEKILKASIDLLFEVKHQEFNDKVKSEVPCACNAPAGPKGKMGDIGFEGPPGQRGAPGEESMGPQGYPGMKGPKGDHGIPGRYCSD